MEAINHCNHRQLYEEEEEFVEMVFVLLRPSLMVFFKCQRKWKVVAVIIIGIHTSINKGRTREQIVAPYHLASDPQSF